MTDFPKITLECFGFGDAYTVTIYQDEDDVRMKCSCPNGQGSSNSVCWHRLQLIAGNTCFVTRPPKDLSENLSALLANASWLPLITELEQKKLEEEQIKKEIQSLKAKAAKAMNGY